MINIKDLKLFTLFYIDEHDRLTKEEKKYLYNFTESATKEQIIHLLMTGKPVKKPSIKEVEYIASWSEVSRTIAFGADSWERGIAHGTRIGVQTGTHRGLAAAALVAAVLVIATKAYKRFMSKAAKACKTLKGIEKTNCMSKFKQQAQKAKIGELQKGLSFCAKTKKPGACADKLKRKISIEKAKLGQL